MLGNFKEIESERLVLKKLSIYDLKDFYEYASNEFVGGSSTWKPHSSLEESRKILSIFLDEGEYLGIHHREDKKMIGILGLHPDPLRELDPSICRELGYGLNYNYWGRGYMTEACLGLLDYVFSEGGLELLTASTSIDNKKSQRIMEKLGMKKEGFIRYGWINYRDEVKDKYLASITRDEYFKLS